jgi:hypothetical protein
MSVEFVKSGYPRILFDTAGSTAKPFLFNSFMHAGSNYRLKSVMGDSGKAPLRPWNGSDRKIKTLALAGVLISSGFPHTYSVPIGGFS